MSMDGRGSWCDNDFRFGYLKIQVFHLKITFLCSIKWGQLSRLVPII